MENEEERKRRVMEEYAEVKGRLSAAAAEALAQVEALPMGERVGVWWAVTLASSGDLSTVIRSAMKMKEAPETTALIRCVRGEEELWVATRTHEEANTDSQRKAASLVEELGYHCWDAFDEAVREGKVEL